MRDGPSGRKIGGQIANGVSAPGRVRAIALTITGEVALLAEVRVDHLAIGVMNKSVVRLAIVVLRKDALMVIVRVETGDLPGTEVAMGNVDNLVIAVKNENVQVIPVMANVVSLPDTVGAAQIVVVQVGIVAAMVVISLRAIVMVIALVILAKEINEIAPVILRVVVSVVALAIVRSAAPLVIALGVRAGLPAIAAAMVSVVSLLDIVGAARIVVQVGIVAAMVIVSVTRVMEIILAAITAAKNPMKLQDSLQAKMSRAHRQIWTSGHFQPGCVLNCGDWVKKWPRPLVLIS